MHVQQQYNCACTKYNNTTANVHGAQAQRQFTQSSHDFLSWSETDPLQKKTQYVEALAGLLEYGGILNRGAPKRT